MDDKEQARFDRLIASWQGAAADVIALLEGLPADVWPLPTDLPGWSVQDIAAHLAHLESTLAGVPQADVEVPELPHVHGVVGRFTEAGVIARREWSPEQIVEQLKAAIPARAAMLAANPPNSLADPGDSFARVTGWNFQTLLNNRPIDLWMHEQDIRRAVGRPGNLESVGAEHTRRNMLAALGFVIAKRAGASAGQSVALNATGPGGGVFAFAVGDDGRCSPLPHAPDDPTVTLTMTFEEWMARCGGRGSHDDIVITGDQGLGQRVVEQLSVTP